ncbi:TetR/AcrR family transcriptional regulator [Thermoactinospora rubra]|uniref:TetR/AcrR family transcriptional regulator n=1 Tax=Thermoactinospora rubra TaxID=1088767 RepID=UPI000A10BF44|nr:TetR/AcrR family transcriptional regulator [Thermoactinospora rubra]
MKDVYVAPLDPDRETAILDATLQLLSEVGYDRMSIDQIARRARASKATIYRRWAGKPELVVDVICRRFDAEAAAEAADTGSLRGDVISLVAALCRKVERKHSVVMGLSSTLVSHQELARTLRAHMPVKDVTGAAALLERAGLGGKVDPARLHSVAEAMVWHRMIFVGPPLDDDFAARTADEILLPLIQAWATS